MTLLFVRTIGPQSQGSSQAKRKNGVEVSIKLVVSGSSKESRIALVGQTGKELLASATFTEPRAKGATLRALKKVLGPDVQIEDSTTASRQRSTPGTAAKTIAAATAPVAPKRAAKKTAAAGRPRRQATTPAGTTPARRKSTARTAKAVKGG
jgi:hypothetical protein